MLHEVTAAELDRCWAVNARAVVLLVQAFVARAREDASAILFTSGQHLSAMSGELLTRSARAPCTR